MIEIGKEVKGLCDEETEVVDLEDWKSLKEEVEEMVDLETDKNEQRNGGRGETRSGFEKSLIERGEGPL